MIFAREVRSWLRPPPLGQHRLSRTGSRQRSQLLCRASTLLCFTAWNLKLSTTPKRGFYNLTNGCYLSSQFLSLPPPLFVADIVELHYSLAMSALLSHRERVLFSDLALEKTPAKADWACRCGWCWEIIVWHSKNSDDTERFLGGLLKCW